MLTITVVQKPIESLEADIIALPVSQGGDAPATLPKEVRGYVQEKMKQSRFNGDWGKSELFIAPHGFGSSIIAVMGTGVADNTPGAWAEGIRRAVATAVMDGRNHLAQSIAIVVPRIEAVEPIVESLLFTNYWFSEHSTMLAQDEKMRSLQKAVLVVSEQQDVSRTKKIIARSQEVMRGITLARHLVNQPASHMSPTVLVQEAKKIAKTSSQISLKVLNRAQAAKKNMFGFLAVARGSKEEPYVIHLTYTPTKKPKKTLVLIGKGITFDSGGLSLKPAASMETMKIDMAGAATVLGVFSLMRILQPDVAVHGIIAACENMPSGDAYRPGDVIKTMSGKTIEVFNTDAEGRVTLADMLTYAQGLKPNAIVDLATLTGACVVALGETYAGLFGNSEQLNTAIKDAAKQAGEGLVEFPLPDEYRQTVQGQVGDVRNTSIMKTGGAITAALFLQEFITKDKTGHAVPWAHMDIAGPVYAEAPLIPYWQFGATGYGVRTLVNLVESFGK